MNNIFSTAKKNRLIIKRAYPWSLLLSRVTNGVFNVLFPTFIYMYMFKGRVNENFFNITGTNDYITYIVLGSALNVMAVSVLMNVGRAMINEIREGTLEPFLLSNASRVGYFIGCFLEQTERALLEFFVVILVGLLLGAQLISVISMQVIISLALAMGSFFSMAMLLSSIMVYTRESYITQSTIFIIMDFICGVMFPVELLPKFLQYISKILPLTHAIRMFRLVVSGEMVINHLDLLFTLLILSIIYFVIGIFTFNLFEKKLVEDILS